MNKKFFLSLLNLMVVAAMGLCVMSCSDDDDDNGNSENGSGGESNEEEVVVGQAVDLGLSVKFADRNIGAKSVEDLGTLYAWAETETKTEFSTENYFDKDFSIVTSNICGTEYDVAKTKWGNQWRMMTWDEVLEMKEKCTVETITQKGVIGMRITGPNGNSIFIPYSYASFGFYQVGVWTGTIMKNPYGAPKNSAAYLAIFTNYAIDGASISTDRPGDNRVEGFYVRAVCDK